MEKYEGGQRTEFRDAELVAKFREGTVAGRAVMRRLIDKSGLAEEVAEQTLTRSDGEAMTGPDGSPLSVEQYLLVADNHPNAVNAILGFVLMDEQDPGFPDAKAAIASLVQGYLGNSR